MKLISREEVLALYDREHSHLATNVYEFGEMLKDIPVVEERKTGKWIVGNYAFICSLCGTEEWKNHFPKYCPECGAKMEGSDSDAVD